MKLNRDFHELLECFGRNEFDFGDLGLAESDFTTPDAVIQLGYPPNRVDLLMTPSGIDFESCWRDRVDVDMGGLVVPFIGVEGLKANKRAVGRTQDLADVEALEQRQA